MEVLLFNGPRRGPPPGASVKVNLVLASVRAKKKYLGLGGRWLFDEHFRQLAPKLVDGFSPPSALVASCEGATFRVRRTSPT